MWALVYQGKVAEVVSEDPEGKYHPSFEIVNANEDTQVGMLFKDGVFSVEAPSKDQVEYQEITWRNSELIRADGELNKVQDADPKAIGTVGQWREYRKNLRAYPESEGFSSGIRPVSPK